jgi:flavodoxin
VKIAIVVHSNTGTTRRFADRIAERLRTDGHTVELTQLETDVPVKSGTVRGHKRFSIINLPDCAAYDAVFVGGPVWAFSASPVIYEAVKALKGLSGKRVVPFVTMGFPLRFMGGTQAIGLLSTTARQAGAEVLPGAIAPKMFHDQDREMKEGATSIAAQLR